jgi:hypothetical protein
VPGATEAISGIAFLVGNPLRLTQIATGLVVPLTGLLSLLDFDHTATRFTHLQIGRVAIVSGCDVVGDVAELGAKALSGSLPNSAFHTKVSQALGGDREKQYGWHAISAHSHPICRIGGLGAERLCGKQ